jgi:hypothetical protein
MYSKNKFYIFVKCRSIFFLKNQEHWCSGAPILLSVPRPEGSVQKERNTNGMDRMYNWDWVTNEMDRHVQPGFGYRVKYHRYRNS